MGVGRSIAALAGLLRGSVRRLSRMGASRLSIVLLLAALLATSPWVVWQTIRWTERQAYDRLADQGRDRLTLYGVALQSEMEKSRNIPVVLSSDHEVAELLSATPPTPPEAGAMVDLDRRLKSLRVSLGVAAVYGLDRDGNIVASSNWDEGAESFVGQHLRFRPYFIATHGGREGRYFAVGSTAGQPGYYIAMPVWVGGEVVGAITVKTLMDQLERGWSGGGERVFVTDRHGIVFITNTPKWRFRALQPLSSEERAELGESRQYADQPLAPLAVETRDVLTRIDGEDYLKVSQTLTDGSGWTLHVLLGVREARASARDRVMLAVAALGLAVVVLLFLINRDRLMKRHARDLSQRVDERTSALKASNERLIGEVGERMRAESELKAKQAELVQAAKLAALGQMSAGIVHEVNQPLAAIRGYADNAVTFLGLGRFEMVRENLLEIAGLTERMARITGQLKLFARKSSGQLESVAVGDCVDAALALLGGALRSDAIRVEWRPPAPDLRVLGEGVRLQQVMINLIRNAQDAMRTVTERCLFIEVEAKADLVEIRVGDTGSGMEPEVAAHLFDPFFTTKPAGEGLGLGLSISEGIVKDFGGRLSCADRPEGGAVFTVTLQRTEGA